jgi:hypothetical protein
MFDKSKRYPKSEGLTTILNVLENLLKFQRFYHDENKELVRVYHIDNEIFIHIAETYWFASEMPF